MTQHLAFTGIYFIFWGRNGGVFAPFLQIPLYDKTVREIIMPDGKPIIDSQVTTTSALKILTCNANSPIREKPLRGGSSVGNFRSGFWNIIITILR